MKNKVEVQQIFHAGQIYCDGRDSLLFDPLLNNNFFPSLEAFPKVKFNYKKLEKRKFSAIFVSHFHEDHLNLDSLSRLNRKTPIYVYSSVEEYKFYLQSMGFENVHLLFGKFEIQVGDFRVSNVECANPEIETAFLIENQDTRILNIVDCVMGYNHAQALKSVGKIDLCVFPFQCSQEVQLFNANFKSNFEYKAYRRKFSFLRELNCEDFVLGSCQFQFVDDSWQNSKYFSVTRERFARDLERLLPKSKIHSLLPGEIIQLSEKAPRKLKKTLDFVGPISKLHQYHWEPFWSEQKKSGIQKIQVPAPQQLRQAKELIQALQLELKEKVEDSFWDLHPTWSLELALSKSKSQFFHLEHKNQKTKALKSGKAEVADVYTRIDLRLFTAFVTGQITQFCFYNAGGICFAGFAYELDKESFQIFDYNNCPASKFIMKKYSGNDMQNALKRIQLQRRSK